jgi:hypothetical protein
LFPAHEFPEQRVGLQVTNPDHAIAAQIAAGPSAVARLREVRRQSIYLWI